MSEADTACFTAKEQGRNRVFAFHDTSTTQYMRQTSRGWLKRINDALAEGAFTLLYQPIVALADGTLIRWMLSGLRNPGLEQRLIQRYLEILEGFREERIPVCSYISMPGNTEVVNLVRLHLDEHRRPPSPDESLAGMPDRWLFARTLGTGERTAVFESASHIQKSYGADNRICYFYVCLPARGGTEVGRDPIELARRLLERGILVNPHVHGNGEEEPWRHLCTVGLVFKVVHTDL